MVVLTGLAAGLGAAFFQSLSYLFSKRFLHEHPESILPLLTCSHLLMAAASLVLLPFLWHGEALLHAALLRPMLGASGFYLLGQAGLFWVLRKTDSSRIAPMLGLKILMLALIVTLWQGQTLGMPRWIAVCMSVGAAFLLNEVGGRLPMSGIAGLGLAIAGYSLSDLNIVALVKVLAPAGRIAPFLGVALGYVLCGVLCLPLLAVTGPGSRTVWKKAAPHAACWLAAMFLLYICFGAIGAVFGNIIQSLRGVISIWLSVMVVRAGWTHLEARLPRHVFWKRVAGAVLMLGAIVLYALQAR